jgi:hypothetical protein
MAGNLTKAQRTTRNRMLALRPGASAAELRDSIIQLCGDNDYDPIAEMMSMAAGRNLRIQEAIVKLAEELERLGDDEPFDANDFAKRLRSLAESVPQLSPSDEIAIHKEIATYVSPKLKSMDVGGVVNASLNITLKQYNISLSGSVQPVAAKTVEAIVKTPVPEIHGG